MSSVKGGKAMLLYYNHSLAKALKALFPEVPFDIEKFHSPPRDYWNDSNNRRKYFATFAKRLGIDPLIAENWYSISFKKLRSKRIRLPGWYDKDLAKGILTLFPDIGLDPAKLYHIRPREYFDLQENRKNFLLDFGKKHSFDPLLASNWNSVTRKMFVAESGGRFVLHAHSNSLTQALVDLLPHIGFDKQLLT